MALEIKPIPVLRGKAAERFVEEADRNARERRGEKLLTFAETIIIQ